MVDPFLPDAEKLAAVREMLPATGAGFYLDAATAGPFPAETAQALQESDDWESRVGRVGPDREADVAQREEEARAVIAALLAADPAEIVLTHGVADALARLQAASDPTHPIRRRWHVDGATGAFDAAVARPDPAHDEILVLDASHSAGVLPIDPDALAVDAVVLPGHRWLLGPEGTGALWLGSRARVAVDPQSLRTASDPVPRRSVLGLARSVVWLEMYVGLDWAYERTRRLAELLADALIATDGVDVLTPRDRMAAIVSFRVVGWAPDEAADELSRRVFAIVGQVPGLDALRASVGFWNTDEELQGFVEAVRELARHTPETLPRRPSLVVLRSSADEPYA